MRKVTELSSIGVAINLPVAGRSCRIVGWKELRRYKYVYELDLTHTPDGLPYLFHPRSKTILLLRGGSESQWNKFMDNFVEWKESSNILEKWLFNPFRLSDKSSVTYFPYHLQRFIIRHKDPEVRSIAAKFPARLNQFIYELNRLGTVGSISSYPEPIEIFCYPDHVEDIAAIAKKYKIKIKLNNENL